jgi:ketosteroid isomerase-like protein
MSRENVELARRLYAVTRTFLEQATAGEDVGQDEYWAFWDPDVVLVEIAELPDATTYRGLEGVRRWVRGWLDPFDEISIEPQELIAVGDYVVVPTRQRFRSKAGVQVEQAITQVIQIRDGKIIYATGYRDRSRALEAVGLRQ